MKKFTQYGVMAMLLALLFSITASAQTDIPFFGKQQLINGYTKAISGETISYFSVYPNYAKEAILTRTTDGKKAMEWETATVPLNAKGPYVYFSWIAAHSTGSNSGARHFDLYVNDKYALTITTLQRNYPPYWTFGGSDSTRIVFELKTRDGAEDAHGFAYLRVPLANCKKGEPVRIKIIGQNQNSNDWFMTFKYTFEEKMDVDAPPLLLRSKSPMRPLNITVLHFGAPEKMHIVINRSVARDFELKNGINALEVKMPVSADNRTVNYNVHAEIGNTVFTKQLEVRPIIHRDVYLVHNSHNDIGYSNTQEEVEQIQDKNIRDALHIIRKTKNYPLGSRFVWNVESLWAVENFMNSATPAEKEEFLDDVKSGSIGLSAMYANILSGLCTPEEMNWITLYADSLRKTYKLPINTGMMTDIPGLSWSMVHALASNGVRYFSNGPNYVAGMADWGDRIGYILKALADKPFWWKSPSGKDSILFWTAGKGYSSWHGTPIGGVFERGPRKIADYMTELDKKGYPYSMVQWRYNIVSDNGPIDSTISDFVKQWNEKYISPKLILSNVGDMFSAFEKKYGKSIPVMAGDLTPYWEDGAYSTAKEEAENRLVSEKILQMENIARQQHKAINAQWLYKAKRGVVMFHEHTWGAYNSISEPDVPFVVHQWNYKKAFVDSAIYYAGKIESALFPPSSASDITVYNSLPWKRSGYVEIAWPAFMQTNTLVDDKGNAIPVQKLSNGNMAFIARDVPAKGKMIYKPATHAKAETTLSSHISFNINYKTGTISALELNGGKNHVNTNEYSGLGEAVYVKGLDPVNHFLTSKLQSGNEDNGPVIKTQLTTCSMEGTNGISYELSTVNGSDDVKLAVTIDKRAIPNKEAIHIAFPFSLTDPEVKIGIGNSYITPEKGQLPGANKDFYSVQRWLDVSDRNGSGVTISSPETALFEVGSMVDEREINNGVKLWKKENHSSATVFAYVMNNYWHTNYKASQEGKVTFNFYLHFHKAFNLTEVQRFAEEATQPLLGYVQ